MATYVPQLGIGCTVGGSWHVQTLCKPGAWNVKPGCHWSGGWAFQDVPASLPSLACACPCPCPHVHLPVQMDFNLLGMGHIRMGRALFRPPLPPRYPMHRPGWDAGDEDAADADHQERTLHDGAGGSGSRVGEGSPDLGTGQRKLAMDPSQQQQGGGAGAGQQGPSQQPQQQLGATQRGLVLVSEPCMLLSSCCPNLGFCPG